MKEKGWLFIDRLYAIKNNWKVIKNMIRPGNIKKEDKMTVCEECYIETDKEGERVSDFKSTLEKVNLTNKDNIKLDTCEECE